MTIDFGRTASDYGRHRAGFPDAFFDRIQTLGLIPNGTRLLDLGTGTGTIARGMAQRGCVTSALDISEQLIATSKQLDSQADVQITYHIASAEETGLADNSFDVVTAGQCWHWFDGDKAAQEVKRLLVPNGHIIIAHFDWLPLKGNMVEATEALIQQYSPLWMGSGGNGFYPQWLIHLGDAGFVDLETFSFDINAEYSHEAWRGRIRASAGVGASLTDEKVDQFDIELKQILQEKFPDNPIQVPHRVFVVIGRKLA
jgi:SAM-dependent methyltransferase